MRRPIVTREELEKVWAHIAKYNDEMGGVQQDVAVMRTKIALIEKTVDKLDQRSWYIATGIILTIGIQIAFFLMK